MFLYLEDKETNETIEYSYYMNFNALYGYFHKNHGIDNLKRVYITKEIIDDIYVRLNAVKYNSSKAGTSLPYFKGPLFGVYDYDLIYKNHVRRAATDFFHTKFLDYNKFDLYIIAHWHY